MATTIDFLQALADPLDGSVAKSILETLSFPRENITGLVEALKSLQELIPYLRAIDASHATALDQWVHVIPRLILVANELERSSLPSKSATITQKKRNRWHGQYKIVPLLSCMVQDVADPKLVAHVMPAKAILFATYLWKNEIYPNAPRELKSLNKLCDRVRRGHFRESPASKLIKTYLPPFEGDNDPTWIQKFGEVVENKIPPSLYFDTGYTDEYSPIRQLYWALQQLGGGDAVSDTDGHPSPEIIQEVIAESEPDLSEGPSTSQHRTVRESRSLRLFYRPPSNDEATSDALEPEARKATIQPDIAADEPAPSVPSQALEVRYTNFRTALDNQRLPWTWDRLNPMEMAILIKAIREADKCEDRKQREGASLAWLMLATGKQLPQLLQLVLAQFLEDAEQQTGDALIEGGTWCHYIFNQPQSYSPKPKQKAWLAKHVNRVPLYIPTPLPSVLVNSVFQQMKPRTTTTLGGALSLSLPEADEIFRSFLASVRDRRVRLLPGRIRQVLENELMQITGDKVLTYLIAGLPTEMPPAGVYYTAYRADIAQRAYSDAIKHFFKD